MLVSAGGRSLVIGAGKAGVVIAWDRRPGGGSGRRRSAATPTTAGRCRAVRRRLPGAARGRRDADGVRRRDGLRPGRRPLHARERLRLQPSRTVDVARADGRARRPRRRYRPRAGAALPQPDFGCATVADGVVFTSTLDGRVYGFDTRDGRSLWRTQRRAGINACPALAGGTLLVGAGCPARGSSGARADRVHGRRWVLSGLTAGGQPGCPLGPGGLNAACASGRIRQCAPGGYDRWMHVRRRRMSVYAGFALLALIAELTGRELTNVSTAPATSRRSRRRARRTTRSCSRA